MYVLQNNSQLCVIYIPIGVWRATHSCLLKNVLFFRALDIALHTKILAKPVYVAEDCSLLLRAIHFQELNTHSHDSPDSHVRG